MNHIFFKEYLILTSGHGKYKMSLEHFIESKGNAQKIIGTCQNYIGVPTGQIWENFSIKINIGSNR